MTAHITALYASLSALLVIYLASNVAMLRKSNRIGIGDQGNQQLIVRVRAHANAIENIPITLLLMLVSEINGLSAWMLHMAGMILVASRIAHAYGFIQSKGLASKGRFFGTVANWLLMLALALANIALALFS